MAQTASTRIQLEPGARAVTVEGDVEKDKEVSFVFQAKAGLKFSGHLTTKSGKAGFEVNDPDGNGLPEEEFDFNTNLTASLPKTAPHSLHPHRGRRADKWVVQIQSNTLIRFPASASERCRSEHHHRDLEEGRKSSPNRNPNGQPTSIVTVSDKQ